MAIRLRNLEIFAGLLFLAGAGILFSNSRLCLFNRASCGMVEPLLALPLTWLGICVLVAGIARGCNKGVVALAYVSVAVSVLLVVSQWALAHGSV
ncbi:hypothetical protein [Lysobacter niastensis]|uniref:Transmembrane protein n=1 Tax=Lysobacter niastensis TaxID=380629 RepID=A0ABS0B8E1_9GAMM|nr:hypothetical protein [Lysobacter niastensis]MBF6023967.1 hypothetical protein [Lysobacter niastensis]